MFQIKSLKVRVRSSNSMSGKRRAPLAAVALILLGIFVVLVGEKSLPVLIPAAVLVWYGAAPRPRSSRN